MTPPPPGQLTAAQEDAIQIVQEMLTDFCTKGIWHRYCVAPTPSNATPEFKALTTTTVDDRGVRAPTYKVPASFLERALRQLNRLFEVCRADRRLLIQQVIRQPDYQGQDVYRLLAEEIVWVRGPDGPWSKEYSLGEIGLLLECVGVKDKGSIWKG